MNTLLSYPRSGNHFARFIIEFISGKPTRGCCNNITDTYIAQKPFDNPKILTHVNIKESPIVAKSHHITPHTDHPEKSKKLIFLLRNFFECIVNHNKGKLPIEGLNGLRDYMALLKFYTDFQGQKMIIYYEDLLVKANQIAQELYDFLELTDDTYLKQFLHETDNIVRESRRCKQKLPCYQNKSKGQLIYYSKKLSLVEINSVKIFIKQNYPEEIVNYLERYF